ncbi:hypothetical protein KW801_00150 [Candidatus Saccharibacteria bacterium]|nr:hypothetical protein [Candidatus Saccharibacteria bacterium]
MDLTSNGSNALKSATETISHTAPKIFDKTGEIAKPVAKRFGAKLGILSQRKPFWQSRMFYIPAAIFGFIVFISHYNKNH